MPRSATARTVGLLGAVLCAFAQMPVEPGSGGATPAKRMPVAWSLQARPATVAPGGKTLLQLTATIEPGWHVYSLTTPKGGGIPATIVLEPHPALASVRLLQPRPEKKFDPNFNAETERFDGAVQFLLETALASNAPAGPVPLLARIRYSACTDRECLPPRRVTAASELNVNLAARASAITIPDGYQEVTPTPAISSLAAKPANPAPASPESATGSSLGGFVALAFLAGLAATFTPCVFPMIPITLSFFLQREGSSRGAGLRQALVFCCGIIVFVSGLGLAITALLGASGVVQLGSNPWVNGVVGFVLALFALSLLGAYEINLPSGLLTRLNSGSSGGGYAGTLLMGLTFSLTSFACVGPFLGTLLAASVQGGGWQPVAGMVSFGTGLASPFFLLALFPSYLRRLPRSGGWLARVKVVLGFVVLAAALKYFSSVDQVLQAHLLTRELFLAAWCVLFALPGFYLLGFLPLEGIKRDDPLSVGRLLVGACFLIFALSLAPGMFGARLGELEAYVPEPRVNSFALGGGSAGEPGLRWIKNDLAAAREQARQENRPLLVSFTGYACTNCHWMKANLFPRPEIATLLANFVLLELYTDGTDAASEENQKVQESRFGTVAIPFYAIMDADDRVLATSAGLTKDTSRFVAFLSTR